jgi:putative ABC transport system permease protein
MIRNYLKTALRNLYKQKGLAFINITGLAIGIACAILILVWGKDQLSIDKTQVNKDYIYRLEAVDWVELPAFYDKYLTQIPEIEKTVRLYSMKPPVLAYNGQLFPMENFVFAEDSIFDIFSLPFVQRNNTNALDLPYSLVLTQDTAQRIFGNQNPIGKIVKYNGQFNFTVTGVIKNTGNIHVKINALASFQSLPGISGNKNYFDEDRWNYLFYLLLHKNTNSHLANQKIDDLLKKEVPSLDKNTKFILRSFKEIYFAANLEHETGVRHGNLTLLILFSVIAMSILFIACINFINLTTAKSSLRKKEICTRKVVGADQANLIMQFMGEALVTVFFATMIALFFVAIFLPTFNRLVDGNLGINYLDTQIIGGILLLFIFTGFAAGLVPALYLAAISPVAVLKGDNKKSIKSSNLRTVLVVFQFTISCFLIIGTITVLKQINFMKNKDLGFNPKQIININLEGELLKEKKQTFRERLLQNPDIKEVCFSENTPGNILNTNTWLVKGQEKSLLVINTSPEFVQTFGLEIIAGRNFSRDLKTDFERKLIINQEAIKYLGFESPIGQIVRANFGPSEIIGVVKDFHFNSLQNKITPLAICWYEPWTNTANIKISGKNIEKTITYLQQKWAEFCPGFPFKYSFQEDTFAREYNRETRLGEVLVYFTFLAIFLASLGLFGLSAFMAERKTKEIVIRKIHGASNSSIVFILSKVFSKWVLIANIFAWPLGYVVMNKWLQNFAYKTNIGILTFVLAAFFAVTIAFLTVSYQVIKASRINIITALKYN